MSDIYSTRGTYEACPNCEAEIQIPYAVEDGQVLECENCGAKYAVEIDGELVPARITVTLKGVDA